MLFDRTKVKGKNCAGDRTMYEFSYVVHVGT